MAAAWGGHHNWFAYHVAPRKDILLRCPQFSAVSTFHFLGHVVFPVADADGNLVTFSLHISRPVRSILLRPPRCPTPGDFVLKVLKTAHFAARPLSLSTRRAARVSGSWILHGWDFSEFLSKTPARVHDITESGMTRKRSFCRNVRKRCLHKYLPKLPERI